jgi:hypothetical protein
MALTPQQIAALSGEDPSAYYGTDLARLAQARAGLIPAESIAPIGATTITPGVGTPNPQDFLADARKRVQNVVQGGSEKVNALRQSQAAQAIKGRAGMIGSGAAGLGVVANQLGQQQPLGAVASLGGSAIGGKIGAGLGGRFGPAGRAVGGFIGAGIGGFMAGEGAEMAKAAVTGAGKGTSPGGTEAPAYIPGTNIPLNDSARFLSMQGALQNQQLELYKGYSATDRAGMKDIISHNMQAQVQLTKSLQPVIEQAKTNDQVRTQALMNTQGNIESRLGMLATQGALAKGAQAEAGALARTFAGSNPYAQFAVRQSPSIQFG